MTNSKLDSKEYIELQLYGYKGIPHDSSINMVLENSQHSWEHHKRKH